MHKKRPKICTCCRASKAKFFIYHSTIIAKARPEHPSVQINLTAYICTCIGRRVVFTRERLDWTIESDGMSSFVPFRVKWGLNLHNSCRKNHLCLGERCKKKKVRKKKNRFWVDSKTFIFSKMPSIILQNQMVLAFLAVLVAS